MDIVIKSVFEYIQSLSGHTNTVLAGGAPRDILLGLTPKDYDICLPSNNSKQLHDLARSIVHEFSVTDMVLKTKDYEDTYRNPYERKKRGGLLGSLTKTMSVSGGEIGTHASKLTCVYGFTFEGKKIDLIGHREDDDEDFPNEVIQGFDYGINMVYDTGSYVNDDNSFFHEDLDHRTMTLVNLPSISELPKAMHRYERLSGRHKEAHGYELRFRSTCLELNRPKSTVSDRYDPSISYKKFYGGLELASPDPEWNQQGPQMATIQFGSLAPVGVNAIWDQPEMLSAFTNTFNTNPDDTPQAVPTLDEVEF